MALVMTIELLTGSYEAGALDDRQHAQWRPHPARLFCALVAGARDDGDRSAGQPQESHRAAFVVTNSREANVGSQAHPVPDGRTTRLVGENRSPANSPRRDHDLAGTS